MPLKNRSKKSRRRLSPMLIALAAAKVTIEKLTDDVARLTNHVGSRNLEIHTLNAALTEARRRTIAMSDGSEINFLPLYVQSLDIKRDIKSFKSWGTPGLELFATGLATATIVADGATIQYTPIQKKS